MDSIPIWLRCLGFATYLLPWSDALSFGPPFLGLGIVPPPLQVILILPAIPLHWIDTLLPFGLGGLLLFLLLFLAVARNPRVPYFLRFNTLQAILLDILLIVVNYAFITFGCVPAAADGLACETFSNTVFLGSLLLVGFATVQCMRGLEPDIPNLSDAVRMQLF